jgi:hypothetical protein
MSDPNDLPINANFDVIQGARTRRTSPSALAQIAALNAADDAADPSVAGNGTMTGPSSAGGHHWTPDSPPSPAAGAPAPRLATALSSAPMPPPRPTDLGAPISALANPPSPSSPQTVMPAPVVAASAPRPNGAMANPPRMPSHDAVYDAPAAPVGADPWMAGVSNPAFAADPGAANRAALYRQLNPTGSPIRVPLGQD